MSWVHLVLPFLLNSVEGSEAALLVAASAARGGWRRAGLAAAAAAVTLVPVGIGLYFLYQYVNGSYIDYSIAGIIFLLGASELREGLSEKNSPPKQDDQDNNADQSGWRAVWPAYVGSILEGGEALLYTFAIAHSTTGWVWVTIAGVIGFAVPWVILRWLRDFVDQLPEWQVETSVGIILMSAATIFGILRFVGIIGG